MKISLLHPSRGRPVKATQTYQYWMSQASGKFEIEHVLSLDFSDPENENYERFDKLSIDHNDCVVEATNQAAKIATGDIFVYLSDDFKCPQNWDELIVEKFNLNEPMLLKVDDLLQRFEVDVLTIPIMNRALYTRLGYFWNPIYRSMFVDQDLFWVCANSNWINFAPELKFPHEHYSNGKAQIDSTYTRSDLNWNQGKEMFAKRKAEGFTI